MTDHPRPGRTFELKVLIFGLLIIALASGLRVYLAIFNWRILPEIGAAASPLYLALSAGIWSLSALIAAAALYLRRGWAPFFTRMTCAALAVWYWADRLLLNLSPLTAQDVPFAVGATVLALFFIFGTLALKAQKAYFNE